MDLLYDCFSPALYGVIGKIIGFGEEAEDAMQEVFVKIWNNSEKYNPNKGRIYTWILNITRNHCVDFLRSKRHNNSIQTISMTNREGMYDEGSVSWDPAVMGIREIVDKLPEDQKQIIDLVYFKGYTQSEISDEFNIPLGTVKSRLRLAMNKLRAVL